MNSGSQLILIRTRAIDEYNSEFAEELRQASGFEVRLVVDERKQRNPSSSSNRISLHAKSYRDLGLYTPDDAAWRCGDYGIYMAWRSAPGHDHYWLLDDDVRISGDIAAFFRFCSNSPADFLAVDLRPAGRDWFWLPHAASSRAQ